MVIITVDTDELLIPSGRTISYLTRIICAKCSLSMNILAHNLLDMQYVCNQKDVKKHFRRSDDGLSRIAGVPSSAITP